MYRIGGHLYDAGQREFQHALATAYEKHARPLCTCTDRQPPFYVARLGSTFVLKRMPFTGSEHSIDCCHYEASADVSGISHLLGTAISEDPNTGVTKLRVDFSLTRGASPVPQDSQVERGVVRSNGAHLTLRGLVHFLWREADLAKWRPGFEGKRNWAVVRSHLLNAASNKVLKGLPLAGSLYVPEPFTVANAEGIRARRQAHFERSLRGSGLRSGKRMILIGELKEVVPARMHFNVVVKHVPDAPFLMTSDLHRKMADHFNGELALWAGNPESHLVVAATFSLTDWGQPNIDELCVVLMSAQWIPADDGFEKRLIDQLVRERRTFDKALGFNSKMTSRSISAVLLDAKTAPVSLTLDRQLEQERVDGSDAELNANCWQWHVHDTDMPTLPR